MQDHSSKKQRTWYSISASRFEWCFPPYNIHAYGCTILYFAWHHKTSCFRCNRTRATNPDSSITCVLLIGLSMLTLSLKWVVVTVNKVRCNWICCAMISESVYHISFPPFSVLTLWGIDIYCFYHQTGTSASATTAINIMENIQTRINTQNNDEQHYEKCDEEEEVMNTVTVPQIRADGKSASRDKKRSAVTAKMQNLLALNHSNITIKHLEEFTAESFTQDIFEQFASFLVSTCNTMGTADGYLSAIRGIIESKYGSQHPIIQSTRWYKGVRKSMISAFVEKCPGARENGSDRNHRPSARMTAITPPEPSKTLQYLRSTDRPIARFLVFGGESV